MLQFYQYLHNNLEIIEHFEESFPMDPMRQYFFKIMFKTDLYFRSQTLVQNMGIRGVMAGEVFTCVVACMTSAESCTMCQSATYCLGQITMIWQLSLINSRQKMLIKLYRFIDPTKSASTHLSWCKASTKQLLTTFIGKLRVPYFQFYCPNPKWQLIFWNLTWNEMLHLLCKPEIW